MQPNSLESGSYEFSIPIWL